jgi:phenylalanyl-tRNA synthetase beta chain
MATVNVNKKYLEKQIRRKLKDDVLVDRIAMMGTSVESTNDEELVVEVCPNRPDMLSQEGIARAFSTFIDVERGIPKYQVKPSREKVIVEKAVSKIRPYTCCAIVKKLKLDDDRIKDIIQIQEKLHITMGRNRKRMAIGIYPLQKISLPIYFTAKDPKEIVFRPLEAARDMNGSQILSQHPTGRAYGHLLEDKEKYPIFIDSKNKILSMPPIINSHDTGKVSTSTEEIFIECSGFDEWTLNKCLSIIVCALADMGGEIYSMDVVYPNKKVVTPNLDPEVMKCDIDYINKRLGLELNLWNASAL